MDHTAAFGFLSGSASSGNIMITIKSLTVICRKQILVGGGGGGGLKIIFRQHYCMCKRMYM